MQGGTGVVGNQTDNMRTPLRGACDGPRHAVTPGGAAGQTK
jgi:hypothetical protein